MELTKNYKHFDKTFPPNQLFANVYYTGNFSGPQIDKQSKLVEPIPRGIND